MDTSKPIYSEKDIKVLTNPIGIIRRNPKMYTGSEQPTGRLLAEQFCSYVSEMTASKPEQAFLDGW
jgi:DNA gyrase/topoisomerase IV subunit B